MRGRVQVCHGSRPRLTGPAAWVVIPRSMSLTPSQAPAPPPPLHWAHRLAPLPVILAAGAYMLHHGWGRWNDTLVDFGRELYFSWQICEGRVLYRDLASFNGPFSPYFNALWFKLAGVSLASLVWCNLLVTAAIIWMVYALVRAVADRFAATMAALAFIFLCGFSQYGLYGNENYLAPYSHEMTHGVALNLGLLLALHRFMKTGRKRWVALAGLLLGLAFLTKVEMFVAAAASGLGTLALHAWASRVPWRAAARRLALLLGVAALPALLAFALLACAMPAREALLGVLGSTRYAFNRQVRSNIYFQVESGMIDPAGSLRIAATMFVSIALLLTGVALIAWRVRGGSWLRRLAALLLAGAVAGGLAAGFDRVPWPELARSLTLWMPLLAIVGLLALAKARREGTADAAAVLRFALPAFALVMLLKVLLRSQLNHYGFALVMPALVLFVAAITGPLPALVARRGGSACVARAGVVAALAMVVFFHVRLSNNNHAASTVPVGSGSDRFYAYGETATLVGKTLAKLDATLRPTDTLAVLPEGVMVNYQIRRRNPTKYTFFAPADVWLFGEANMIAAFEASPPDYILLAHKDTSQFGVPFFGVHYGSGLRAWVDARYDDLGGIGAKPFTGPQFGVTLLKRRGLP